MQINQISQNYNNIYINKPLKTRAVSTGEFSTPINFRGAIPKDCAEFALSKGLKKISDYTISEYKNLSETELTKLREAYHSGLGVQKDYYQMLEYLNDMAATKVEKYCDKKFGEGKYKVITIGRSLSSIGKVLGYKIGEDRVVNVPLSDAVQYINTNNIERLKETSDDVENFTKFLNSKGLSKEELKNKKTKYVIMDYCATGKSLDGAYNLFTDKDVLGEKHVYALDINDCIDDFADASSLEAHLCTCSFKRYAYVGRAERLKDVPSAAKIPEGSMHDKLFRFKLLDNEMQRQKTAPKHTEPQKQSFFKTVWNKLFNN